MTAPPTCPRCGAQLEPVALDPQTAPWLCALANNGCAHGWWNAELTSAAHLAYRVPHGDFGHGLVASDISAARIAERRAS